ncbi:hypothetical protein ACFQ0F_02025 [Paraperlucidibaca wandonensis]|jgi:hypothetical protein|uniref:Uncharacterized protein n=1 Tax=Paraperlucidibaca wandonensis TaxID=1268273 RepID=A0ABW3HHR4_9GAMM
MNLTLITTEELAKRIKYSPHYIRRHLVDNKLLEGVHYKRPFDGRKILFIWERIESEIFGSQDSIVIPMASGGAYHG